MTCKRPWISAKFQSTLSQGERLVIVKLAKGVKVFQSTLSQGERLWDPTAEIDSGWISIHALARRATKIAGGTLSLQKISIHALARRAT